jgi:hypothetical protein
MFEPRRAGGVNEKRLLCFFRNGMRKPSDVTGVTKTRLILTPIVGRQRLSDRIIVPGRSATTARPSRFPAGRADRPVTTAGCLTIGLSLPTRAKRFVRATASRAERCYAKRQATAKSYSHFDDGGNAGCSSAVSDQFNYSW